jgi:hypothetical protein
VTSGAFETFRGTRARVGILFAVSAGLSISAEGTGGAIGAVIVVEELAGLAGCRRLGLALIAAGRAARATMSRWALGALGGTRTGVGIFFAVGTGFAVQAEGTSGARFADAVLGRLTAPAGFGWLRLALVWARAAGASMASGAVEALSSARARVRIVNAIDACSSILAESASGAWLADTLVEGLAGLAGCRGLRLALVGC